MSIDTEKLEAQALAATQGPWYAAETTMNTNPFYIVPAVGVGAVAMIPKSRVKPLKANAEFIAAANPAVVLALLAEVKRLTTENAAIKAAISDPEQVFINMKAGAIAKISLRSAIDLHGPVINGDDAQQLEIARLRADLDEAKQFRGDGEACLTNRDILREALGLKLGDGLLEHVMALQLNAERYLCLRNQEYGQRENPLVFSQQVFPAPISRKGKETFVAYVGPLMGENLDKATDAARGAA